MQADLELPTLVPSVPTAELPTGATPARRAKSGARAWAEEHALYIAAVTAVAVLSLGQLFINIGQDTFLALVAGRLIAQHGLPHHDYLTVMAHGAHWVDQQWLAQLLMYGLAQLGGLKLLSLVYVGVTSGAVALAILAARRLGGIERNIVVMLPFGIFFYVVTAISLRTQGFAYPFFVATLWLLATAVRRPEDRRVYLVFPLLIIWGNVHGSVTLGVGLAVLYGLTRHVERMRSQGRRTTPDQKTLAFVLGAPVMLFATPYGFAALHYYRSTLFNSEFSKLVTEWRPVTDTMGLAIPFLVLLVGVVWLLGRSGSRTPLFDQLALLVLGLGGVIAVRNVTWFGLAAVILAPAAIGHVRTTKPVPRRTRLNFVLAATSLALIAMALLVTLARPARWFESTYDQRGLHAVARLLEQHPNAKIFADVHFGDWLVWHAPRAAGHIAYDTSFELLTAAQLDSLSSLTVARAPGQADPLAQYTVLVLNPVNNGTNRLLLSRPGVKVVMRTKRMVVATKPRT